MKQNFKVTFGAVLAALATVFMLLSFFPYLTYAVPAISGLFIMIAVIELNKKYSFLVYLTSGFLIFLFAEPESKLLYICFFGFYPILKAIIEILNKPLFEYILKFILFNMMMVIIYSVFAKLFNISLEDFGQFGKYSALIFLGFGNIVFFVYDFAISRFAVTYYNFIHPKVKKIFKF